MKSWREAIRDGAISGSIASLISTVALGGRGRRDTGTSYAPTNAISHWIWGDGATDHDEPSARYTGIGYLIHHASSTWWAVFYEKWFGRAAERGDARRAVGGGAMIAALACFVDYRLTPHRLQPGFEKRLSMPSMFLVYASFGLGLALRGLAASRSASGKTAPVSRSTR